MDNKKLTKSIVEKIKNEDIKQTPKYIFILKNIIIWTLLIFSIFLGSLSLGISFDYIISADWYLLKKIGLINIFIVFIPVFWIVFLIVSSFLSYYNYRNTNKGYKLSFLKVISINVLLSLLIAILFYIFGTNTYIESKLEKIIPKYRSILVEDKVSRMINVWQNEDNGLLIGKILEIRSDNVLFIDSNNKKWNIIINKDIITDIKHKVILENGENIKIIGDKIDNNSFNATEIRPFLGKKFLLK